MGVDVVALVSGGKDSTYAMMKCVAAGHKIVALANLHPPAHVHEELDSFMYQTVGHAHVARIAEAMALPLYRREIAGTAVDQKLRYAAAAAGDEVEDLHALLADVKAAHPSVAAVCSGAILSNYQRSRVEHVCGRLGLTSYAYLWQRNQAELLPEMVAAGVDAVLVKVASLGLDERHLGKTLGALRPHFEALHGRFGFHICGEGGEYETFTLDCPLYQRRLEPRDAKVIVHSADAGAPVALLSFGSVELVEKPPDVGRDADADAADSRDDLPDDVEGEGEGEGEDAPAWALDVGEAAALYPGADPAAATRGGVVVAGGLAYIGLEGAPTAEGGGGDGGEAEAAEALAQLRALLAALASALEARAVAVSDVLFCRLYVRRMAHYKELNAIYSAFFEAHAPAARAAVELPLAGGAAVALEVVGRAAGCGGGEKRLLHVQSISEWAPRMIGPYCQLTTSHATGFVAGNLGLVPHTMALIDGGIVPQTSQALRNCAAVLDGLGLSAARTLHLLLYVVRAEDVAPARAVARRWLARWAGPADDAPPPPLLVLVVGALPMGALVEAQLEAATADAPAPRQLRWELPLEGAPAGATVRCALAVGPLSVLQAVVACDGPGGVGLAAVEAAVRLAARRLRAEAGIGDERAPLFVRAFYEAGAVADAAALRRALAAGVGGLSGVLVLPVERIGTRGARLAVQLVAGGGAE